MKGYVHLTDSAAFASVQQFLDRQHGPYIDGAPCAAQSENRLTVWDPATGQAIKPPPPTPARRMSTGRRCPPGALSCRSPLGQAHPRLTVNVSRCVLADLVEQHGEELAQPEPFEQGNDITISRAL
ncbi:aldehyde dehydrogenase [Klebsiella pneumoniae]|nr:aldehyde dehydrogenase [Klebsiella pneumoniae]